METLKALKGSIAILIFNVFYFCQFKLSPWYLSTISYI